MNAMVFYFCVFLVFCVQDEIFAAHRYVSVSTCENDLDCDHLINASCENEICMCDGSKICEKKYGVVVNKVGLPCDEQSDCNVENSECKEEICVCKQDYTYTADGKKCLPLAASLGDMCEDRVQCYMRIENSGCQNFKCVCQQHMHEYNGKCYKNAELDESCTSDGECSGIHFAKCINSRCSCIAKYIGVQTLERKICLPIAEKLNDSCAEDVQCTVTLGQGSACIEGSCQCKEIFQLKENINKCVRDMLLNDPCETHSDCHQPFDKENRLECVMGICKCRSFYKEMDGLCLSRAHHYQAVTTTLVFILVIFLSINFL